MNSNVAERAADARPNPIARAVAVLGDRWRAMLARHAVEGELATLSDRELADVGITRCDVDRLFDPDLAHDHGLRGGSAAWDRARAESPGWFAPGPRLASCTAAAAGLLSARREKCHT